MRYRDTCGLHRGHTFLEGGGGMRPQLRLKFILCVLVFAVVYLCLCTKFKVPGFIYPGDYSGVYNLNKPRDQATYTLNCKPSI